MPTFTFRLKADDKPFVVEAETRSAALIEANKRLLWGRPAHQNFYAWNDEGHPNEFIAMYGVWN